METETETETLNHLDQKVLNKLGLDTTHRLFHADGRGVAGHQIREFDYFLDHDVDQILLHLPPITAMPVLRDINHYKYTITFDYSEVGKPARYLVEQVKKTSLDSNNNNQGDESKTGVEEQATIKALTPQECRESSLNYSSTLFIRMTMKKIHITTEESSIVEQRLVPFGRIPMMVGSKRCITYRLQPEEKIQFNECLSDSGGYFIIGGNEKVMMGQERTLPHNLVCVSEITNPQIPFSYKAEIRCIPENGRNANRTSNTTVFLAKQSSVVKLQSITATTSTSIKVMIPQVVKSPIPIFLLFIAFGCTKEEDYFRYLPFLPPDTVRFCIGEAKVALANSNKTNKILYESVFLLGKDKEKANNGVKDKDAGEVKEKAENVTGDKSDKADKADEAENEDANEDQQLITDTLEYIGRDSLRSKQKANAPGIEHSHSYYINRARDILTNEVLPQISSTYDPQENHLKLAFLSYMVQRVYNSSIGYDKADDRDNLANKRIDLSSVMLSSCYRNCLDRSIKRIGREFFRAVDNPHRKMSLGSIVQPHGIEITDGFEYAIKTGKWGEKVLLAAYGVAVKIGVTQQLNRFMPLAALSQLRKVNNISGKENKLSSPRQLHGTHFGRYCPS